MISAIPTKRKLSLKRSFTQQYTSRTWVIGSGDVVDPGEKVELTVTLTSLTPALGRSKEFTIEVRPSRGAAVVFNRSIPAEVKAVMDLY